MFKRVLVPLDRSPLAEQAIGQAAAIARAAGAAMDLALVHQPFAFGGFEEAPWNDALLKDEEAYLESIAAELSSGSSVEVTHAMLRGAPVEMLCQRIVEVQADLVVMTSHGRTGLSRAWLGSTASGVLRHSTVPVLMLRPIEGQARRRAAHHLFKHILVPMDGSALSAQALVAASALAKCSDARVTLLRVVEPPMVISDMNGVPYAVPPRSADDPDVKRLVDEAREQLTVAASAFHDEKGLVVDAQVIVDSRVAPAILDYARNHAIDVIAMSTHGRGASRLLFGSVTDKIVRGSELAMLLYRPPGA